MKTVTKYIADDGAEFNNSTDCVAHDALCDEVSKIMATLPSRPADNDRQFSNGYGYLQHSPENFWHARDALLRIGKRLYPHTLFDRALADRSMHPSFAGRLIGYTSRPLYEAWYRISCVDKYLCEWGQPYYADNPDHAPECCEVAAD